MFGNLKFPYCSSGVELPFLFWLFQFQVMHKTKMPRLMENVVKYGLPVNRVIGAPPFWLLQCVQEMFCPELQFEWAIIPGVPQALKNVVQPELRTFCLRATVWR
jgi:hypothetical protein